MQVSVSCNAGNEAEKIVRGLGPHADGEKVGEIRLANQVLVVELLSEHRLAIVADR